MSPGTRASLHLKIIMIQLRQLAFLVMTNVGNYILYVLSATPVSTYSCFLLRGKF